MSKTEKILYIILVFFIVLWVVAFLYIRHLQAPLRENNPPKLFPFIYVSEGEEVHLLWNPNVYMYTGVAETDGKKTEFLLIHDDENIMAYPTSHFAHIITPELFPDDDCKNSPLFEGVSAYNSDSFTITITKDNADIFGDELPSFTFRRYDITDYKNGAFSDDIPFDNDFRTSAIFVSETFNLCYIPDTLNLKTSVATVEKDNTVTEFVLFEENDLVYALSAAHLAHMAHPSLFKDDTCLTSPLFEGKLTYKDGLVTLQITKDSANLFDGDLPTIEFTKFDKWEYFNGDTQ